MPEPIEPIDSVDVAPAEAVEASEEGSSTASLDDLLADLKSQPAGADTVSGPVDEPGAASDPSAASAREKTAVPAALDAPEEEVASADAAGGRVTWVPYALYLAAWLALAGASAYLLKDASPAGPARWMPAYPVVVWVGVGLTALGPLLSIGVWLVARKRRSAHERRGLLTTALIRGAVTAVFGVAVWAATIYVLELIAAGAFS